MLNVFKGANIEKVRMSSNCRKFCEGTGHGIKKALDHSRASVIGLD
jgi:hypothetical protein